MSEERHIRVSETIFLGSERRYVNHCLDNRWLSQGYYVKQLEYAFAEFCGTRYAVACNSGTAAAHLALLALGIKAGDAVAVPALTYVATANAVRYCGADPVFVDVDPETWNMCPQALAQKRYQWDPLGARWRGTFAVHLYGCVSDIGALREAQEPSDWILEDACQAHGAAAYVELGGEDDPICYPRVGSLGVAGVFSFYASKIIGAGEGGILVTNVSEIAERARLYRGQGADTTGHYHHSVLGYNYRMPDITAAIALAQLETYKEHRRRRNDLVTHYMQRFTHRDFQRIRIQAPGDDVAAYWVMPILLPAGVPLARVAESLEGKGIETRPFFKPLPLLPFYIELVDGSTNTYPVARELHNRGIVLPLHSAMTNDDVDYIADALREELK